MGQLALPGDGPGAEAQWGKCLSHWPLWHLEYNKRANHSHLPRAQQGLRPSKHPLSTYYIPSTKQVQALAAWA